MGREDSRKVEITIVPDARGNASSTSEQSRIRKLIRERVLPTTSEPYYKIQVEVERGQTGAPAALLLSMLRANTYTADIVRVEVGPDFKVKSIEHPESPR